MSGNEQPKVIRLLRLNGKVPTAARIFEALQAQRYTYEPERLFVRAVNNPKYIATASPFRPGRFGPPPEMAGEDGKLPFTWVYCATDSLVAAWESRLVLNNFGPGSGFHIPRLAEANGVLASIRFARPLLLWNLGADHSSRLGFQDAISERDHEACQLFGMRLREAMLMKAPADRPDGFVYPSHRVKGHPALAVADWAVGDLFDGADVTLQRFVDSEVYGRFLADRMRTEPPDLDAS